MILAGGVVILLSPTALANSSWVWISETRPFDILPWVVVITLMVETIAINFVPKIYKLPKVFCMVTLANFLSFLTPYLLSYVLYQGQGLGFNKYLNHWPSYIVGILYCGMTILVELPVLYSLLKKDVADTKRLLLTILAVNIVTTLIVACFERVFCTGHW